MTEDTPSFTNDNRWMLSEEDDVFSHDDESDSRRRREEDLYGQRQLHQSDMSLLSANSLKSHNNDSATDPNPSSAFNGGQQRNSRVFYYNDSEVVPYDITTESDEYMPTAGTGGMPPSYYYGTGSAMFSEEDDNEDEEEDFDTMEQSSHSYYRSNSNNNNVGGRRLPPPPSRQLPGISLSRHYGARQINANF
ncbi:hypothetical protein INT45_011935 [Circinella minor]|uniref:Uncharacterized protein n=1 Tax=Circinella minor TaxID=1195481 RepID=A0A8H7RUJ6_9FUNG|nr:hypothetical protein INT45_011935 [Circinella minor]